LLACFSLRTPASSGLLWRFPRSAPHTRPGRKAKTRSPVVVLDAHAAGIDIGATEHWVAVPPDADPDPVRSFGTCTADLQALVTWLLACGVTSVALESTGVYGIPLFEMLETRGLPVRLVDARQTRALPGRPKDDIRDCQWIQRLHSCGLLRAAFRPEDPVVVLRSYLRQRQMLIGCASDHIRHLQKALEQLNVKLPEVVAAITGVTGMGIIRAILAGERDPLQLAKLRNRHCQADAATIARALHGNWRAEHLFCLRQALELYEFYPKQLAECDRHLDAQLQTFADRSAETPVPPRPPGKRKQRRKHKGNIPAFDARTRLYRMSGVDLTQIEGIEEGTALVVLREIGLDRSRWPTEKHFCSWLGLCPQHKISGGRILSRKVRPGVNRAAQAFRLAARGLERSQSALGAFFRRLQSRLGAPKAITAAAHKLARLVYSLVKHGQAYVAKGLEEYEREYQERQVRNLNRKARELGYTLVKPEPAEPAPVSG
jgi:transposase